MLCCVLLTGFLIELPMCNAHNYYIKLGWVVSYVDEIEDTPKIDNSFWC